MKIKSLFLALMMVFTLSNTPNRPVKTLTVNATQVSSARDIEIFIEQASNYGTLPVKIILDSAHGDFYYSQPDRSINIYYSNITLSGKNGAVIRNCGDGIFFDDAVADNITIEGLTFICEGLGIAGGSGHKYVTVRNNTFISGTFAIASEKSSGWVIKNNNIKSPNYAIFITNSNRMSITRNKINGYVGVFLDGGSFNNILNNTISNAWHGIYLGQKASHNKVISNQMRNITKAGITLDGRFNQYNQVVGNRVRCLSGMLCQVSLVENPPLARTNLIKGNKFSK